MKSLDIKYQLRFITLAPVFLVAFLFAIFYNGQFAKDLKQHKARLGEAYIRQLLPAVQFAMMKNDNRTLQGLINASTVNPEVKTLVFYNAQGLLLAYRGGKHSLNRPFKLPEFTGDYIESKTVNNKTINFIAPITIPKFNLYTTTPLQTDDILGWLSLDIDTQSMLIKQYQMYIITIFITLLGLLISLAIHNFLSKRIYLPLNRLRRSMQQILNNEFETRITISSPGELGIIEQGCSHLQKQYLNSIQDLNHHIEVATSDLQQSLELLEEKNIELSLKKKKIAEKNRQKSEFIAKMSHEIRTPMNGVIGFANVLLETKLDNLQMDYVKTIKSSAQDLLGIINDILDYSKMDAGKLRLECIPLDIRGCIDEILALASPNAHKKGIDLIAISDVNVPQTVLGDPLRFKQIISNLISNAVKFTDQGYVLIRSSIEKESEKDYSCIFSVTDTGIGISEEDKSKLFNAFNQADDTITRRFGGSGLGLVICKKLIEEMQGQISLSSTLNKGSSFTAQIKLEKFLAYEVEKRQSHRFSHLKVLCFDDNPLHLEALCNCLAYWGIECVRIDAFNLLKTAFAKHYDCTMAFINVNKGCEKQTAQILRKESMPCALVSKWLIPDPQSLGGHTFLFKPIGMQKLQDAIEILLDQSSQTAIIHSELDNLRGQLRQAKPEILIAEDNSVNRMLLNSLLQEHATIQVVNNGEEAVRACESKRFCIILLDLQMPKRNGLEASKQIRQESILNKMTPIIVISATNNELNKKDLQKAGVDFYLQKPIDEKELLNTLLESLKKTTVNAINWQLCVQKLSGNRALAEEYLTSFVKELPENRQEFLQLLAKKDIAGLEDAAHKLHSACCFCGVPYLQTQTIQLEKQAKHARHISELEPIVAMLTQSIDEVIKEFECSYT